MGNANPEQLMGGIAAVAFTQQQNYMVEARDGQRPASVVSKRTWAAVMHTVPSGMLRSASGGWSVSKESTPTAAVAARRSSPRS